MAQISKVFAIKNFKMVYVPKKKYRSRKLYMLKVFIILTDAESFQDFKINLKFIFLQENEKSN